MEGYYYPTELAIELENQILTSISDNKIEDALIVIDNVVAEKYPFNADIKPLAKIHLSALYLEVAETITHTLQRDNSESSKRNLLLAKSRIVKMLGLFKQISSPFISELFIVCNRARAKLILYEIDYINRNHLAVESLDIIRFDKVDSI